MDDKTVVSESPKIVVSRIFCFTVLITTTVLVVDAAGLG
jgi:hypothetical protein